MDSRRSLNLRIHFPANIHRWNVPGNCCRCTCSLPHRWLRQLVVCDVSWWGDRPVVFDRVVEFVARLPQPCADDSLLLLLLLLLVLLVLLLLLLLHRRERGSSREAGLLKPACDRTTRCCES
jgi:hypothetical protein